ncbi:uncharacterized protein [Procambarus clarkii]|uniref:uncharacterized protein isoform X2 n=1 Tax=Procambarus clarkii TaxID=6728 RepID=UPI00374277ED
MLSMCGLLCRMLRGWRHSEAVMLMAKALSQPHSSLLVQDIVISDAGGVTVNEPCGSSPFCQNSNEGTLGQQLWRDNNKQAVIISPKQCVDLQRWTLFLTSSDNPSSPSCKYQLQAANENGTYSTEHSDASGTITVLLEATYRDRDDEPPVDYHVMVEHLSQPYAWKARDVFGVIVTTTPPQLLAMIQAFFNNALLIDDDFLIKKIITIDVMGKPATMEDPLSIPQCVTPGPWNADRMSHTQMEIARSVSPSSYQGQPPSVGCGNVGLRGNSLRPPLLSTLMRHQSSGESATDTSTTINPQSSSDSDKHPSSLDPQSSYDSVSDYPTSEADDVPCNVYNFYPRGWAVSGTQIISGQPLSVRGVLTQLEGKQQRKPCSIVTNPMEDLWQEAEDAQKALDDSCTNEQSILCTNGPSQSLEGRSTLPRAKKIGRGCTYPYRCLQGSVLCKRLEQAEPGRKEREIVKEAAEYYQRALNSAQERKEWAKKSMSSASDEDTPLNEYSFSGIQNEAVVTHEPKKYPVRIKSDADLSRATSIIKDNLANIVQRYLVKSKNTPGCQYFHPKVSSENPTLKLLSVGDEPQHFVDEPSWMQDPDSYSASAQAIRDGRRVGITVVKTEVTGAELLRNIEQYDPTIAMDNTYQVDDHKYVSSRNEDKIFVGKQNINKTELRVESHDDLMSSDKLKLKVLPALTNQCPTKRIESNPKIWISSDKKLKNICAANCKQPVRSSGRSEKKLVKSDEIVAPTIKRESRIDIPFTTEDESKSITLCDQEKVKATTIRQATNLHTNKTPDKVFASHRMQVINTDLKKADETPTEIPINVPTVEGDKCFNKDCEKSDDKFRENMNQIPDKFAGEIADITGTCERIPSEIIIHSPDTISEEKSNSLIIKTERTLEMVQEKQENNASKVVMTAEMFLGTEREVQIEEKVKDFDQSLKVKETSIGEPAMESISYVDKTSDKIDSHADSVMLQKEIYSLSGATIEPNPITTIDDNYVVASQSADLCIESSMGVDQTFTDIPIILGVMLSSNHLQESEICDKSNHLITLENEDVAMLESSEVGEEASDTDNDTSTMKLTQRPKCLKDIHKLNTKSSTASESSFESLPYRMLTSQPDSLSEDIAIELTRAPPDSEKLKAARLELIRQERINAISLHSMSLIELKDDYRCKSVSPEEEFKADSSDIFGDISKSKSTLVDPKLEASPMYNEGQQEMDCSSMFDSGVEVLMHEQMSSVASSLIKSFPSPVESVPESGFSSLKEPLAYEGTTEDGGFENHRGVSFSKSKDSLDLTDTDRFPGTDTLSDDMETFSLSAGDATLVESGPVSTEGSARGSISDSLHQDNSLLKVYPNEPSTLYLDSVGIPITFIEDSSHYNFCEIHNKHLFTPKLSCSLDSTSSKSLLEQFCEECESQEVEYSCKEVLEVLPDIPESNHIVRLAEKAVKCVPEDGNGLNIKTSESLSSEDTVVSRMSFEDRGAKFLSQESLEEPIEVSEPLKISPNDVKDEKIKDLIDVTVNVVNENVRESVDSVAEISINTLDGVNKVPDSHGLTTIIPKGQHTESLPEVLSVCKSEKYLKQVDAKLGVVKEQVTNSKGDQVSELNVPFIVKETNLDEDSKSLTVIEQNEIKATCEVANEFPNVGEYSETGSLQNNIELHLSIADKLKLLNDSELVDPSIKEDSYAALDTKYPDQVIENISHQSEKSNEMELNSIASSVVITQSKEIKKEDKAICNSDVIVSVTSDTSRKSDVSEKSSPNANETCSTGTSDRPSRHSSKSGISDLEDEVFLPPKENYIFDGRPVIYCPKIDMANQIGISPPKVAMSVFAVVPSKHVSVHKGAEWIAANKDDFPKFPSYPVLPEPARNLNMEEKEITDKSVTQSLDIISLATSEPAPKDYSTNISSEVHFVKEDMEPCTTSVNVLNIINGTYKQGLHGCTKQAVGDKVAIINDSSEEYILKIKNEDTIACTEILNDNKNLAAAELQQPNNMVKGCPENIVQKEFQNTNAKLTRHTSISSPTVTKESMRKGGHQSHSLDKVIDAECIPRRDIKFIVDEEKNYKYLHENKSEFKREEISSTGSLLVDDSSSSSRDQINKFNICQLSEDRALGAEHEVGYPGTLPLKEMGEHVKPKLLRMSNLERTDTTASPTHCMSRKVSENSDSTPQESPVLSPVVTHDKMKVPFSFTCLPVDAYSSSSPVSREATDEENSVIENKIDIDLKLSTKKFDEETNSNAKMSENSVENILSKTDEFAPQDSLSSEENGIVRRESQDEEITKEVFMGSEPELKKYGSEESSLLTLDSHGSSTSKGYLEPDLRSVSSSWGASGSLECLDRDKSEKGSQSRRHGSITTAKSEELGMKCDQVSLKSQGSLDKFPHFDQVTSQQKARGARKKILSVDIEKKEKKDLNKEMHRSVTLPAGSMVPSKKDDKKKEKEEKSKKKKKDKEGLGNGEKKSAMLSLKGLLKRNKSKEKEKERDKDSSQEKLSSPSLFRKLERKTKSNFQSPRLDEWRHGAKGNVGNGSSRDVENAKYSPVATNGKTRPVISGPVSMHQVGNMAGMGVTDTTCRGSGGMTASGSDSDSPIGSRQTSPKRIFSHPRMASLGTQPSPRLYKHVLTRHLSSSQESVDNPLLSSTHSSPQASPHTSPKRMVIPASASSYSLPASRDMSPPAPVMGTRALRGSSNSFSVTIGFKPKVEKRNRTMSEGADLNNVSLSPVSKRKEGSRILTQLNKRSSSMEILVCGKIREHCSQSGKSSGGSPFSREGSFRLHREISVETLFELPETSPRSNRTQEEYQEYLNEIQARNDSHHGSSWSLVEESDMEKVYPDITIRRNSHHTPIGKKLSLPHNMHLSGLHNAASSNPNLQRNGSPFVRGVPHSSSFTSSPFRRPHSSAAVFSPAKRVMSTSAGGSPSSDATPGAPLMRVEEEGPCRKNLDNVTEKPPNVLVYAANKTEYFTAVKETLLNCLNVDRYTIYQLTDEMAFKSPWAGSTTLLVVCGDVPAHVSTVFIRYLLQGGRVFSVCSDFLNMAVPLFAFELPWTSSLVASGTVEVQEQAVVSISYRRWSSVHLLHHQHCFHSSPQHKRFSQDMENIKGKDMRSAVSVEPTHVEIIDEYGGQHRLDLKILATDDTWGAPSLLSAKVHDGKGSAVFSQVHLERDPRECFATSGVISKLAISNEARLEILRDLLSTELSLDTTMSSTVTTYSPAYFLGRHELKQTLLNTLKPHMEGQELKRPQLTIQFVTSGMAARQADETVLPLLMSACPLTFSTALKTSAIGRLVIYCDVMTSSMKVTAGHPPLIHGIVVLPTQQTHGKGRSGNSWLSPLGCVMFTSQLHIALSSNLGQHLTFLQHLAAMAIVQAVREHPGYADIPIHLKWPNDIYIGTNIKIGGVIVEATTVGSEIIANVGCGVNLSNSNPTYCINDAIRQHNKEHNTSLSELDRETFLARIFNYFEDLIETFQVKGPGAAQHIYYKYWLHSNATVTVQNEHRRTESAVIVGVDNYGFLEAQLVSGTTITLQPDGNSFNMMDGLIYSKLH